MCLPESIMRRVHQSDALVTGSGKPADSIRARRRRRGAAEMRAVQYPALIAVLGLAAVGCGDNPTGPGPLVAPTNVNAVATTANSVRVTLSAVKDATGYVIQRASESGTFSTVGEIEGTEYEDTGLTPSTTYRYRVAAKRGGKVGPFSSPVSATTLGVGEEVAVLAGSIGADRTLYADTAYVLHGFVHVRNGATLTIQPGTRIVGDTSAPGSSLIVGRGSKLMAVGTVSHPIVFTSQRAAGKRAPGDWGGIAIVGRGRINLVGDQIRTEGPHNDATVVYSGGTDDNDDSGVLRYVRIEFAGFAVLPDLEVNSLSLYAVGRGTTMDHVQVVAGLDDSFKWFGGAVDAKYLVSYESSDDHFDVSQGYRGRNQFLIGLQTKVLGAHPGGGSPAYDVRGFESDGCELGLVPGCLDIRQTPYSMPLFANFTVVGYGNLTSSNNENIGLMVRRGSGGTWVNGIVARFPDGAITVRDAFTDELRARDSLIISHLLLAGNGKNFDPPGEHFGQEAKFATSSIEVTALPASALFASLPDNPSTGTLDWTPAADSPARTGGLASFSGLVAQRAGSFIQPTSYRGAADPAGPKWWEGWTAYYRF